MPSPHPSPVIRHSPVTHHHQAPGSMIVFCSLVDKKTVLDTAFVVGKGVDVSV